MNETGIAWGLIIVGILVAFLLHLVLGIALVVIGVLLLIFGFPGRR